MKGRTPSRNQDINPAWFARCLLRHHQPKVQTPDLTNCPSSSSSSLASKAKRCIITSCADVAVAQIISLACYFDKIDLSILEIPTGVPCWLRLLRWQTGLREAALTDLSVRRIGQVASTEASSAAPNEGLEPNGDLMLRNQKATWATNRVEAFYNLEQGKASLKVGPSKRRKQAFAPALHLLTGESHCCVRLRGECGWAVRFRSAQQTSPQT